MDFSLVVFSQIYWCDLFRFNKPHIHTLLICGFYDFWDTQQRHRRDVCLRQQNSSRRVSREYFSPTDNSMFIMGLWDFFITESESICQIAYSLNTVLSKPLYGLYRPIICPYVILCRDHPFMWGKMVHYFKKRIKERLILLPTSESHCCSETAK